MKKIIKIEIVKSRNRNCKNREKPQNELKLFVKGFELK